MAERSALVPIRELLEKVYEAVDMQRLAWECGLVDEDAKRVLKPGEREASHGFVVNRMAAADRLQNMLRIVHAEYGRSRFGEEIRRCFDAWAALRMGEPASMVDPAADAQHLVGRIREAQASMGSLVRIWQGQASAR